ncbi:MAG: sulfite exporter TauE/SafE family protein [Flavobacteriales bacterium]|nr:sulfite exporter TauE/SafE family protein [Flavobacteriales bacterium]
MAIFCQIFYIYLWGLISKNKNMTITTILILVIIGLLAGILSGIVGIGGGLIMIPMLILFLGLSQQSAQGTSLAVMLPPIGILAAMNYYKAGFVEWKFALIIATTFIIGGYFGAKFAVSVSPTVLKKIFGAVLLVAAIKMIFGK